MEGVKRGRNVKVFEQNQIKILWINTIYTHCLYLWSRGLQIDYHLDMYKIGRCIICVTFTKFHVSN